MLLTLSAGYVKLFKLDNVIGLNSTLAYWGGTVFSVPICLISVGYISDLFSF